MKRKIYSYRQACEKYGLHHQILADGFNSVYLNCMGTKVPMTSVCKKIHGEKVPITRGRVNLNLKEAVCEWGERAMLKVACDKNSKKYCKNSKEGCQILSPLFAASHNLHHHILSEGELRCIYTKKDGAIVKKDITEILEPVKF